MTEYYTVQQVVNKMDVSAHTLRYYERIGLLPPIGRAESGHRRYTDDDLGWVRFLGLLRNTGMPIQMMQSYVELERAGDMTIAERLALLENHQRNVEQRIACLQENLTAIGRKMAVYRELLQHGETDLTCE